MDRKYKVCFLGYKKISDMAQSFLKKSPIANMEVIIMECTPETLDEHVQRAQQLGCDVFVAGSSNAAEFKLRYQLPLVEVAIQSIDYVIAIKKALEIGSIPALVTYRHAPYVNIHVLEDILDIEIKHIVYDDSYDLREQLKKSHVDVVVGASVPNDIAESLSIKCVLLYPGQDSVEVALRRAYLTAKDLRKWQRNQGMLRLAVEYCSDGLIGVNENGRIVLYNPAAEVMVGLPSQYVKGKNFEDVFPKTHLLELLHTDCLKNNKNAVLNQREFNIHSMRVESSGTAAGIISILTPIQTISQKENVSDSNCTPNGILLSDNDVSFDNILRTEAGLLLTVSEAKQCGEAKIPFIITGEFGVGKRTFASAIHNYYADPSSKILYVDCSLIPSGYSMQYLYGRENKKGEVISDGIFSAVKDGTLVLENIWDSDIKFQRCLAAAIRYQQYSRLGGREVLQFRSRVITIIPLEKMRQLKELISLELYHAISVLSLEIPPLRSRKNDIVTLFNKFVRDALEFSGGMYNVSPKLIPILKSYSWPGNARELENISKRFCMLLESQRKVTVSSQKCALIAAIGRETLFEEILDKTANIDDIKHDPDKVIPIIRQMKETLSLNNSEIASRLGISRTTMWRLCKQLSNDTVQDR